MAIDWDICICDFERNTHKGQNKLDEPCFKTITTQYSYQKYQKGWMVNGYQCFLQFAGFHHSTFPGREIKQASASPKAMRLWVKCLEIEIAGIWIAGTRTATCAENQLRFKRRKILGGLEAGLPSGKRLHKGKSAISTGPFSIATC